MQGRLLGLAVLVAGLTAGAARAQDYYDRYGNEHVERRREVNVFLKGGVGGYTGELANVAHAGPTYGLTVNLQPLNILGVEIGYEGSRNHLSGLSDASASVYRNGASALMKVAPPFLERIKPFVGAGLGASLASIHGSAAYRNDLMEEVPLAAGLEFNSRSVTAGVRATYRLLVDEGFAGPRNGGLFDASVTLGGRF